MTDADLIAQARAHVAESWGSAGSLLHKMAEAIKRHEQEADWLRKRAEDLAAECSRQQDAIERLTAERDAARAQLAELRPGGQDRHISDPEMRPAIELLKQRMLTDPQFVADLVAAMR